MLSSETRPPMGSMSLRKSLVMLYGRLATTRTRWDRGNTEGKGWPPLLRLLPPSVLLLLLLLLLFAGMPLHYSPHQGPSDGPVGQGCSMSDGGRVAQRHSWHGGGQR